MTGIMSPQERGVSHVHAQWDAIAKQATEYDQAGDGVPEFLQVLKFSIGIDLGRLVVSDTLQAAEGNLSQLLVDPNQLSEYFESENVDFVPTAEQAARTLAETSREAAMRGNVDCVITVRPDRLGWALLRDVNGSDRLNRLVVAIPHNGKTGELPGLGTIDGLISRKPNDLGGEAIISRQLMVATVPLARFDRASALHLAEVVRYAREDHAQTEQYQQIWGRVP